MDVFSLLKFWRNAGVGNADDITDDDDDGSFFDLVFTNTKNNLQSLDSPTVNIISGFHYKQSSKLDGTDHLKSTHTHTLNIFNKTKILPLDSSSNNSKTPRSPFRVLMLGFQNTKHLKSEKKEMKCEIHEESFTIASLLKRDYNSLRSEKSFLDQDHQMPSKRFSKDVVHKYLNLIKPALLYIRRSNEKLRLHQHTLTPVEKQPSVFKEVRKHLGKSRSSSSSSVFKPVPRRDDSVLQQQDGIQSAILHCKKSYNSPSQLGCHVLSRSGSAPSQGPRISIEEEKRSSI